MQKKTDFCAALGVDQQFEGFLDLSVQFIYFTPASLFFHCSCNASVQIPAEASA